MPDQKLTVVETAAMLTLVAEAREVPNAFLTNVRRLKLPKGSRLKLVRLGFISVRAEKNLLHLDLTESGWKWCGTQLGTDTPAGAGAMGGAMFAWLANITRHLERSKLSLADVFGRFDGVSPEMSADEVEARIREAYLALAPRPGEWVKLSRLRPLLGGIERTVVDPVLIVMSRQPDVTITPESNQKMLTQQDRDSAVIIGNQEKHAIAIGV